MVLLLVLQVKVQAFANRIPVKHKMQSGFHENHRIVSFLLSFIKLSIVMTEKRYQNLVDFDKFR